MEVKLHAFLNKMEVSDQFHTLGKRPLYLLVRRLGGLQSWSGHSDSKHKYPCPYQELYSGDPAHS
jgi:hypothetical protein